MKSKKILAICILVIVMLAGLCACGGNSDVSTDSQTVDKAQAAKQAEEEAVIQAQTNQQATAEVVIPTAEPESSVDSLIGSWTDINSPDRFANIIKTESGYELEDNDGKYPGEFKDGVLKLKVSDSDGDTADVYVDAKTGHMFLAYKGDIAEFQTKK